VRRDWGYDEGQAKAKGLDEALRGRQKNSTYYQSGVTENSDRLRKLARGLNETKKNVPKELKDENAGKTNSGCKLIRI